MQLTTLISTQQVGARELPTSSEGIINNALTELKKTKTAWRTSFKSQLEVDGYKEHLLTACIENGINTQEQIDRGLSNARKDESDFLPSVGKFIGWCKVPQKSALYIAIEQAERQENQKKLDNKTHTREFALNEIRKIKEKMGNR